MTTIADRVKDARARAGLTQEELARQAGLSTVSVYQIEQGKRKQPYYETLHKLAQVLGVSTHYLFTGEGVEETAVAPKAEAPYASASTSRKGQAAARKRLEETGTGLSVEEERLRILGFLEESIVVVVEKLDEEFEALKESTDRKRLETLFSQIAWSTKGVVSYIETDEEAIMQSRAGETGEEQRARRRVRRALARMEDLAEDIQDALAGLEDGLEESPAANVTYIGRNHLRGKRAG